MNSFCSFAIVSELFFKREVNNVIRFQIYLFRVLVCKGEIINILGFAGHIVSITAI